ncbi:MAG: DUF2183 domain-containing protein, partial [Planctomycetales bacterium]
MPTLSSHNLQSQIDSDESVIFFPTYAHPHPRRDTWVVLVHGWIFEPDRESRLRSALMKVLFRYLRIEKDEIQQQLSTDRARAFLVANERGKKISVRLGGRVHTLKKSRGNGHFHGKLELTLEEARSLAEEQEFLGNSLSFQAITQPEDYRAFHGRVHLIEPQGRSLLSDIDDTIKISGVIDRRELLTNTFLNQFQAVPGMAKTYAEMAETGTRFHYVSSSPWQLYSPLARFMQAEGFPAGPFHLRNLPGHGTSLGEVFTTRGINKRKEIEKILRKFPQRKFILVGDSGEKDPRIYAKVAARRPDQVELICIRVVTPLNLNSRRSRGWFRRF